MRKLTAMALTVAGLAATAAPAGAAVSPPGPCATVRALFEKYKIELGMHIPIVEDNMGEVCRQTG